jgi:hypothetical protein
MIVEATADRNTCGVALAGTGIRGMGVHLHGVYGPPASGLDSLFGPWPRHAMFSLGAAANPRVCAGGDVEPRCSLRTRAAARGLPGFGCPLCRGNATRRPVCVEAHASGASLARLRSYDVMNGCLRGSAVYERVNRSYGTADTLSENEPGCVYTLCDPQYPIDLRERPSEEPRARGEK